jgi:molybdopterin adenylyltransferase
MKIARITLSDRASKGVYEDKSGPEIERVIRKIFDEPIEFTTTLIPDDPVALKAALLKACDEDKCVLVITTGGTGPGPRDITPETTLTILEKELPGFGELMRMKSYVQVPTAVLSRAVAGIRGKSMVINLPGRPNAILVCLTMLQEAISEGLHHMIGFRPKLKKDAMPEAPVDRLMKYLGIMKK